MAGKRAGKVKTGFRMLMWLLAVIAAAILLLILMQQLGMVDIRRFIPGRLDRTLPPPNWQEMELLDQDRVNRMMEANGQRAEELDVRTANLDEIEIKLEEQRKQLEKGRDAVEEEKKRLQEEQKLFDKKKETITQTAKELTMMDMQAAVAILEKRDNQDVIWIMQVTDELAAEAGSFSLVPTWLSMMDSARAAEIQRERDLIPEPDM